MNIFPRVVGQNNKIYRKFGDYCVSEEDNSPVILCACCQIAYSTDGIWEHVQVRHNLPKSTHQPNESVSPNQKRSKVNICPDSPMYVNAEYLENIEINSPSDLLELDEHGQKFFDLDNYQEGRSETSNADASSSRSQMEPDMPTENDDHLNAAVSISDTILLRAQHKHIDVDRIPSSQLVNGKILKRLFRQMHLSNIKLKYRQNKLTQELKMMQKEVRRQLVVGRRYNYMKILPDAPFTTREEVLILDEELHKSKEMRDALHDEVLHIMVESAESYCRTLWRFLMTDKVSVKFCWRGVIDGSNVIKYPTKDLTIVSVFQDAFREKFPEQTINYFKERTMLYFNKAPERIKRSRTYQKSRTKSGWSNERNVDADVDNNNDNDDNNGDDDDVPCTFVRPNRVDFIGFDEGKMDDEDTCLMPSSSTLIQ